jgi:capsid protein
MKRTTRTELSKIVMIGMSKIDQVVNKLCDDCVADSIDVDSFLEAHGYLVPDNTPCQTGYSWVEQARLRQADFREMIAAQQRAMFDPFAQQRAAGAANVSLLSGCGRFI